MELAEYHYTYYSYEEYGNGYIGSRTCKCLPEEDIKYFGSYKDKNFKPTQKIILKDDYSTREEAYDDEIILQEYYKVVENPHFANRAYQTSTKFYVPKEQAVENGKNIALKCKENGTGLFSFTEDERLEIAKKSGTKVKELRLGIFAMTEDEKIKIAKKGYKNGLGKMSKEKRSEIATKVNSQKWKCLITGHISNAGGLSRFQNKKGIDKSFREMV